MPETTSALDIMLALVLITSPFWGAGLIIGFLMRNKFAEKKEKKNMEDRLDLAMAEQKLQNMRREQQLEDYAFDLKRQQIEEAYDDVVYEHVNEETERSGKRFTGPRRKIPRRVPQRIPYK